MELYNCLDRLRLAIHAASGETPEATASASPGLPPVTMSTMMPTIFVSGAPSQTVIVNNGGDQHTKKDEKKDTTVRDNVLTAGGMGLIALMSTAAAAKLYNRHRHNQAITAAYSDVMATYRALFPNMPYLNSCGFTDIDIQYTRWHANANILSSAKRLGVATASALGLVASWRFDWPLVGYASFGALVYLSCRGLFNWLTAGPSAETEFAQAVARTQRMVWAVMQNKAPVPPPTYQNVD